MNGTKKRGHSMDEKPRNGGKENKERDMREEEKGRKEGGNRKRESGTRAIGRKEKRMQERGHRVDLWKKRQRPGQVCTGRRKENMAWIFQKKKRHKRRRAERPKRGRGSL